MQAKAGCLGASLLAASGQTPAALGKLNREVQRLRDSLDDSIGGWKLDV